LLELAGVMRVSVEAVRSIGSLSESVPTSFGRDRERIVKNR